MNELFDRMIVFLSEVKASAIAMGVTGINFLFSHDTLLVLSVILVLSQLVFLYVKNFWIPFCKRLKSTLCRFFDRGR